MNWIKVTDKLPELNKQVIVRVTGNKANIAYRHKYKNECYFLIQTPDSTYKENNLHKVTHWAEIPEPPQLIDTTETEYKQLMKLL